MPGPDPKLLHHLQDFIRTAMAEKDELLVVGICGAQGSGKSTLCAALEAALRADGIAAASLSIDDLYLSRAERADLAATVHPLFATRGVPGTHDPALGLALIDALARGEPAALPRFDKGRDDPMPQADWPLTPAGCQVLLLEGWCLGARPQDEAALADPVNALERHEDPHGLWRSHANAMLGGQYQQLFARIDHLILLAAPGWDVVARWRDEAEERLRQARALQAMDGAQLARFMQHYERLTRWILQEMPGRADLTIALGAAREVLGTLPKA